jgi:hypothetical protein
VISRVDSGDITPPERTSGPSRTELLHRLESADALLANLDGAKTATDLRALVMRARDLLNVAVGA